MTAEPDPRERAIPFGAPSIGVAEIEAVVDVLRSGWLTSGPQVRRFEDAMCARLGSPAAVATSSCTAALELALAALGVGPGDEVVTPGLTMAATVNVIRRVGAVPVIVDILPTTMNIDPVRVGEALTPRTRAVIPVHYAGYPCDMAALRAVTESRGIAIVEDAAHAVATTVGGRTLGDEGRILALSFYANKNLATGEGGMLLGPVPLVEKARCLAVHGINKRVADRGAGRTWHYDVVAPGAKFNMPDIQAAIGLVQLACLDEFQARRRQIAARYTAALGELSAVQVPHQSDDVGHGWWIYPLRVHLELLDCDRDSLAGEMAAKGVGTSVHFPPVQGFSFYRQPDAAVIHDCPVTWRESSRVLSLPLQPSLDDRDVERVVEVISHVVQRHERRTSETETL